MKVNEAPEKIYLDIEPNLDDCTWHLTNPNGDSVEYIRTKDVDLDKEIDLIEDEYHGFESLSRADIIEIIKHFFELGMAVNNKLVKGVDLDKEAEWIANGIMIAVQSAKLHTNVYNPDRKDYDHSHLMQAARRGIELGLKIAQKGEEV